MGLLLSHPSIMFSTFVYRNVQNNLGIYFRASLAFLFVNGVDSFLIQNIFKYRGMPRGDSNAYRHEHNDMYYQ